MTTTEQKPAAASSRHAGLAPELRALLGSVRGHLRRWLWLRGIAVSIVALVGLFWLLVAVDWKFESPRDVRLVLLVTAVAALGYLVSRYLLSRVFAPISDRSLALLIERQYPLDDSLLTAVELARHDWQGVGREMFDATVADAVHRANWVKVDKLFDVRPPRRALVAAMFALLTMLGFSLVAGGTFRLAVARMLTVSNSPWPRATRLVPVGFRDGELVVARGNDLRLVVNADTSKVVPDRVTVRYWAPDGSREQKTMVRVGNAQAGRDPYQEFEFRFQSVLEPLRLEIRGGDARLRDLRIRVVESPSAALVVRCKYPSYFGDQPERVLPASATVPAPLGSELTLLAEANKPLRWAKIVQARAGQPPVTHRVDIKVAGDAARRFELPLGEVDVDQHLQVTLHDTDEVENREPLRLSITAVPDVAPQVQARIVGIGSAITPSARLPMRGKLTDDHGVSSVWANYQIDEGSELRHPLAQFRPPKTEVQLDEGFEVDQLKLKPGQKLIVGLQASDNFRLPASPTPNVGRGDRYLLDVVTPPQLRALLEAREMNLRLRYETILATMIDTRNQLAQMEPAATAKDAPAETPEQRRERRQQIVSRARQNSEKSAQEILGVATSFDDIGAELVNNRVDTSELLQRLRDYIAEPLRRLVGQGFPRFNQQLTALDASADTPEAQAAARQAALAAVDAILVEMQKIRDKMLELEDFNQALEMLRTIIATQQEIDQDTKKRRSEKIRQLIED
ncbi:MAG: DUF1146 domain-containing protein [Planctomycetes bacterium]|nr:DUF1146 domain-containing protein [Planctomycetota bacterium]